MDWCFCPVEVAGFGFVCYLPATFSMSKCFQMSHISKSSLMSKVCSKKNCRKRHWMFWPVNDFGRWAIELILPCGMWMRCSRWKSHGTTKNIFLLCYTSHARADPASCLLPLISLSSPTQQLETDVATALKDGLSSSWGKWPLEFRRKIMILLIRQAGIGVWAVHTGGESSKGTCLQHQAWQEVCLAAGEKNCPCVWKEQRKRD